MTPATTLLEALQQFLREQVQPELTGFTAYQNRIAANLLNVLRREAQLGPALRELDVSFAESHGLPRAAAATELARAIRDGRVDDSPRLREYLRQRALLALAIDNPRYSGYLQARKKWPAIAAWLDQRRAGG